MGSVHIPREVKVLSAIRPMTPDEIAAHTGRAQYNGYRDAPSIAPDSHIPTYPALQLYILPPEQGLHSNYLALCIQPQEGIH